MSAASNTPKKLELEFCPECGYAVGNCPTACPNHRRPLRIAYADPPYPGCAHLYKDHPDYAGEVDHEELLRQLTENYDGWCLHTSSVALGYVTSLLSAYEGYYPINDVRVMAWVKPFAAFKANVSVAYAWEPVLVKAARKPVVKAGMTYRDFMSESITLKRGLTGAKPERVCHWLFEVMGCEPHDELADLYPGTGAVFEAWQTWRDQRTLFDDFFPRPEMVGTHGF